MNTALKFSTNGTFCNEWGTIDEKGIVYRGKAPQLGMNSADAVGFVDSNGYVYAATSGQAGIGSPYLEGYADLSNGNVYSMLPSGAKHYVGCVDAEGYVRVAANIIGRVDPATDKRGAAAIILLLKKQLSGKTTAPSDRQWDSFSRAQRDTTARIGNDSAGRRADAAESAADKKQKKSGDTAIGTGLIMGGIFAVALLRTWIFPVIGAIALLLSVLINVCKGRHFDKSVITFKEILKCAGSGLLTYIAAVVATMIVCSVTGAGSRGVNAAKDNEILVVIMAVMNALSFLIWDCFNKKRA